METGVDAMASTLTFRGKLVMSGWLTAHSPRKCSASWCTDAFSSVSWGCNNVGRRNKICKVPSCEMAMRGCTHPRLFKSLWSTGSFVFFPTTAARRSSKSACCLLVRVDKDLLATKNRRLLTGTFGIISDCVNGGVNLPTRVTFFVCHVDRIDDDSQLVLESARAFVVVIVAEEPTKSLGSMSLLAYISMVIDAEGFEGERPKEERKERVTSDVGRIKMDDVRTG
eukprot:scaffold5376_cov171-Amphora_coffeaeformis.AAC.7